MKSLDEIAIFYGTDKATEHHVKGHGYCPHYDSFFDSVRHEPIKVLEIGVGGGESIKTWLEYFTKATVYGVDTVKDTNPWNTSNSGAHERYTFVCGDQSSETFWECFKADYGRNWDIIIDDGGHYSNQVITSFKSLWPVISLGGLYCVEDLGVAYGSNMFVPNGWLNHMTFIKNKVDEVNKGDEIQSIHFFKELAIFRKSLVKRPEQA